MTVELLTFSGACIWKVLLLGGSFPQTIVVFSMQSGTPSD